MLGWYFLYQLTCLKIDVLLYLKKRKLLLEQRLLSHDFWKQHILCLWEQVSSSKKWWWWQVFGSVATVCGHYVCILFTQQLVKIYSSLENLKWETPLWELGFLPCCINHKKEKTTVSWLYFKEALLFRLGSVYAGHTFNTTKFGKLYRHTSHNFLN